jgi:hypothetical protein
MIILYLNTKNNRLVIYKGKNVNKTAIFGESIFQSIFWLGETLRF